MEYLTMKDNGLINKITTTGCSFLLKLCQQDMAVNDSKPIFGSSLYENVDQLF